MPAERSASAPTAASMAPTAMSCARAPDISADPMIEELPGVLMLIPPHIEPTPDLPAETGTPGGEADPIGIDVGESALAREALRLRARWGQELSARAAWELGPRLAEAGVLESAESVALLHAEERVFGVGYRHYCVFGSELFVRAGRWSAMTDALPSEAEAGADIEVHQALTAEQGDDGYARQGGDEGFVETSPDPFPAMIDSDDDVFDVGATHAVGNGAREPHKLVTAPSPDCGSRAHEVRDIRSGAFGPPVHFGVEGHNRLRWYGPLTVGMDFDHIKTLVRTGLGPVIASFHRLWSPGAQRFQLPPAWARCRWAVVLVDAEGVRDYWGGCLQHELPERGDAAGDAGDSVLGVHRPNSSSCLSTIGSRPQLISSSRRRAAARQGSSSSNALCVNGIEPSARPRRNRGT